MKNPILQRLDQLREQEPDATFIKTVDFRYSRQSFWNASRSLAVVLRQQLKNLDSDIVAIYDQDPRYFFVYLVGIWMAGFRVLPLNQRMPPQIIEDSISNSNCKVVIGNNLEIPPGIKCRYLVIDQLDEDCQTDFDDLQPEGAIIMLTSGSTGQPKAIPLTFAQILDNAYLTQEIVGLNHQDKLLIAMPPCFITGISHFMSCVVSGARLVSVVGFNFGEQLIKLINDNAVTAFGGSPTNVRRILGAVKEDTALPSLRIWISSGDHLSRDEQQYFLDRFSHVRFIYMYGLSEVGGRFCVNDVRRNPEKLGSPGKPLRGMQAIALSSEDGSEVASGDMGELNINGPLLMAGYLQGSGNIDHSSVQGGFATGDLGYVDADGYVWIAGRTNDVIKVGGEKVSISNVEDAIRLVMDCSDCTVAIIDDPNLGKVLIGLVVPDPTSEPFNNLALFKQLRGVLPPNALPAKVFAIDSVPRTGSGKVSREEAKDLALALLGSK
jgi:acyl-coenzyme A synthetase/AMP-(fatty) acid ligase